MSDIQFHSREDLELSEVVLAEQRRLHAEITSAAVGLVRVWTTYRTPTTPHAPLSTTELDRRQGGDR